MTEMLRRSGQQIRDGWFSPSRVFPVNRANTLVLTEPSLPMEKELLHRQRLLEASLWERQPNLQGIETLSGTGNEMFA